ncbi:MAG: alkaline phosphatase D family protein [Candidatus Hydrogenedentota bacterium]
MIRTLFTIVLAFGMALVAAAADQPVKPYDISHGQYKRIHLNALRGVIDNVPEYVIGQLRAYAKDHPDDMDTWYCIALTEAQLGNDRAAVRAMKHALETNLPPERFLAGPRNLTAPLLAIDKAREQIEAAASPLLHGPTLGRVTDTQAGFWVRTAQPAAVTVTVYPLGQEEPAAKATGHTKAEDLYTTVVMVEGLAPDTDYTYSVAVDNETVAHDQPHRLHTASSLGEPGAFRLAFGGGAGYVPPHEYAWNTIRSFAPDALMLLGDNVYSDDPGRPEIQRFCYYRRQSRPEWRRLVAQTPLYAIWDDHDFGTNDCEGGLEVDWPPWKPRVWHEFTCNFPNPPYGHDDDTPGCWFQWRIADVDFFFLDGRYYRTRAGDPNPSMLGPDQFQWLKDELAASDATFKVVLSPVPWKDGVKPGSDDTWDGFPKQREAIYDHIAQNDIAGVLLMSADRHRSDAWKIPRDNSYDLYEFESSRLTNQHVHKTFDEAIFSYNEKQSFGLIDFDTTLDDPTITYRIVNIDGHEVFEMTLTRSELE